MGIKSKIVDFFSLKKVMNDLYNREKMHCLTQEETEQIQRALLEMYRDIIDACDKHNIRPFLQGGTLLGKVRHNGFIPWDDDLDLGMSRHDYERFKEIFEEELADRYILMAPNSKYKAGVRFIQIYKINSYYETISANEDRPKKLFIDIFPIDFVPDQPLHRKQKGFCSDLVMVLAGCAEFYQHSYQKLRHVKKKNLSTRINFCIRAAIGRALSFRSLSEWYDAVDRSIRYEHKSRFCTSGTGRKHYFGEIVPTEVFFPLRETDFLGVKAWTLHQPDRYLTNLYGENYMQVPPPEKREHHFIVKVEL